jgi:hypothetical protein
MVRKLIMAVMIVVFCITAGPLGAAEKQVGKANKKVTKAQKCWKMQEPYDYIGDLPVCLAFEEVLNKTCETPDQVACNWTLPPGEKRFKKLDWQPLDWKEYWELIGDINKSGVREDLREHLWKKEAAENRKLFEDGQRSLAVTMVDIDQNGRPERVVRYDLIPCPGSMFGIVIPETKRLDWRFRQLFFNVNADYGAEIMLFDGQAFMFGMDDFRKVVMVYEGFSRNPTDPHFGSINVCQFGYVKGGKGK